MVPKLTLELKLVLLLVMEPFVIVTFTEQVELKELITVA